LDEHRGLGPPGRAGRVGRLGALGAIEPSEWPYHAADVSARLRAAVAAA
jgi:hypothetical protein